MKVCYVVYFDRQEDNSRAFFKSVMTFTNAYWHVTRHECEHRFSAYEQLFVRTSTLRGGVTHQVENHRTPTRVTTNPTYQVQHYGCPTRVTTNPLSKHAESKNCRNGLNHPNFNLNTNTYKPPQYRTSLYIHINGYSKHLDNPDCTTLQLVSNYMFFKWGLCLK